MQTHGRPSARSPTEDENSDDDEDDSNAASGLKTGNRSTHWFMDEAPLSPKRKACVADKSLSQAKRFVSDAGYRAGFLRIQVRFMGAHSPLNLKDQKS